MDQLEILDSATLDGSSRSSAATPDWRFHDEHEARLIEDARRIRPILRRNAAANEAQRSLCDETVAALDEIGVFGMSSPVRWGGLGVSATTVARVGAELAKGDPAASWVTQIINGTTWVTTLASDALQEDLFGRRLSRVCGVFNPPGVAVPVEGGYLVTGRWPYASGYLQADWGQWGVMIKRLDGTLAPGNYAYIPTTDTTLELTWQTAGLQGTGSHTAVAQDVFVPEHRMVLATASYGTVHPGKRHLGEPGDAYPVVPMVHRSGAGQVVGMAEAMLEIVLETATKRGILTTCYTRQMDSAVVQRDVASLSIRIGTARMLIEQCTTELDEAVLARRTMTVVERARNKAQAAYAIQIMSGAVDEMMFMGGSAAFMDSNPISHYWRDFSMAARHVANIPNVGFEVYGKALFGVEPNIVMAPLI